jgi:hypothetical protein
MAVQQTFAGRAKSIAGAALIGLGILAFYKNLHQAATQFSHLLGVIPSEAPGVLPTAILGCLSGFTDIRRRSSSTSAGLPSAYVGIIVAAATRHRRNGIVAGLLHGQCQRTS